MRRRALLHRGLLALLLTRAQIARGATIVAVRVWPAAEYTRVTIESDAALATTQRFVADPPRLAVDIEGLQLNDTLRELVGRVRADDPYIAGVRVGQYAPGVVRLVLDLKQPVTPQVFTLTPVAAYQHRLVLDLYPARPVDPLEQFIAERLRDKVAPPAAAPDPALPTDPDPLGELIARQSQRPPATADGPAPAATPSVASRPDPSRSDGTNRPSASTALPASPPPPGRTERLIVVALDPGHGGEDPGAIGPGGTREKDVVLAIALLLRERINATRVGGNPMRAFLTRDADFFVPLHVRVQKARRVGADLFVSIHADAFFTPRPQGASVFALSERGASSAAARWIADKENSADAVGGINVRVADAQVQRILADMSTTAQINDSLRVGGKLLGELRQVGRLHKPRVEQANFAVLRAPDIPSVLVETAFISNPDEEARLRDPEHQARLADALLRGIVRYFEANPPLARSRPL